MANSVSGTASTLLAMAKSLGKARDGLLLLAGGVYGLGYTVRSLYAWRENLGVVSALDSQYFLAGVAPSLVCALAYAAVQAAGPLGKWLSTVVGTWLRGRRLLFLMAGIVLLTLATGVGVKYFTWKPGQSIWARGTPLWVTCRADLSAPACTRAVAINLAACVLMYFQIILMNAVMEVRVFAGRRPLMTLLTRVYVLIAVGLAGASALFLSFTLYGSLAQELGGLRPDRVAIEVMSTDVSQQAAAALFPDALLEQKEAKVVRSIPLYLLSSQGDYIWVRPAVDNIDNTTGSLNYRVKKDLVRIVIRQ